MTTKIYREPQFYSVEDRMKLIKMHVEEGLEFYEIGWLFGVSDSAIKYHWNRYHLNKGKKPTMSKMPKTYMFDGKQVSARTYNTLRNEGITTLEQLSKIPANQLLRIPNFGRHSLNEVNALLGVDQKQVSYDDLRRIKSRFFKCLVEMEELKKEMDGLIL